MADSPFIAETNATKSDKTKKFCFTVDDNIRFLKEINERSYSSIFDHPYLSMYRRLHEKYGLKIQLNLFYEMSNFSLLQMTNRYSNEWASNADWLKLSFHSRLENVRPYQMSGYKEVFDDCEKVHSEIVRFASVHSLAKTTTVHYCLATNEGLSALKDNGVSGLLGLYGTEENPISSYQNDLLECDALRKGQVVSKQNMLYAGIDIVLNSYAKKDILHQLNNLTERDFIKVMIHEQYFYSDYPKYQPEFEEKLDAAFAFLQQKGYNSIFFEDWAC